LNNIKHKIYIAIILHGDLYGCYALASIINRLRVLKKMVLKCIFEPKRDEVAENLRKLHNEVIYNLYSSPNVTGMIKSRRMILP
jgi:hypothetical protein